MAEEGTMGTFVRGESSSLDKARAYHHKGPTVIKLNK